MTCSDCELKERKRLGSVLTPEQPYPFKARDIEIIGPHDLGVAKVGSTHPVEDWNAMHKLMVFIPQVATPVCESELVELKTWHSKFAKLNCLVIVCVADRTQATLDWYKSEFQDLPWLTFCSYEMPLKLGLWKNGRPKRSTVFVSKEGEVFKTEHFPQVKRDFQSLYNQVKEFVS